MGEFGEDAGVKFGGDARPMVHHGDMHAVAMQATAQHHFVAFGGELHGVGD